MLYLLLAENGASMPEWVQIIGSLTSVGFIAWYAWYSATKIIPDIITKHDTRMGETIREFQETLEKQRTEFKQEIKEQRERDEKISERIVAEFRAETKENREADKTRATVSAELARSGHKAIHEVTEAVEALKDAIRDKGIVLPESGIIKRGREKGREGN